MRRTLAEEGVLTIVCIADPDTGKLAEEPDYLAHGFASDAMDFEDATPAIQRALTKASKEGIVDLEQIEELVRQAASTWGTPPAPPEPADHPGDCRRLSRTSGVRVERAPESSGESGASGLPGRPAQGSKR